MKIKVTQEKLKWNFKYIFEVDSKHKFFAEAKRTILPTKRNVYLKDSNNTLILELKEKKLFKKILLNIPILSIIVFYFIKKISEYDILQDNKVIGEIATIRNLATPQIEATFNDNLINVYEFTLGRNGNKYPVYTNGVQTGLIEKSVIKKWNADNYSAQFDSDTDMISNILMILFVDLSYHTKDVSTEISAVKYEYEWNLSQSKSEVEYDDSWKSKPK